MCAWSTSTTAAKQLPPVYDAMQRVTPGMYERSEAWWRNRQLADPENFRFGGSPKHIAVLDVDGEPQAYAIYRLHVTFGDLGPETKLRTIEVIASTPEATASIWRYLLDVDWTKTVVGRACSPSTARCSCCSPARDCAKPTLSDGLWVRLVDVEAALSGRTYAGEGAVVLDVRDEFCPWNEGRWRLEGGEAEDAPTTRPSRSTSPTSAPSTWAGSRSATSARRPAGRADRRGGLPGRRDLPDRGLALVSGDLLTVVALDDPL